MPNLFSFMPVAILAWVRASTSGLTRIAIGASRPRALATSLKQLELGRGFDIDLLYSGVERECDLRRRLADAGEDDALGRHAGGERAAELALGDDIGAGAEPRQEADHREIRVGLDRIADLGALPAKAAAKRR